jgi:hypothetical protein
VYVCSNACCQQHVPVPCQARGHWLQWNHGNTTNHGTDVGWSRSIACLNAWLKWCMKPFHDKNSYFLEKDYSSIIIEFIILSLVKCILGSGTKYLLAKPMRYPEAKLTLTSISWLAVQYKMGVLRLAFIFCCIRSWMALHLRIKTYFIPVFYTRTFTPVNYHLRLQCLHNCQEPRDSIHVSHGHYPPTRLVTFARRGANCCRGRYQLGPLEKLICSLGPSKPVAVVWVQGWSC